MKFYFNATKDLTLYVSTKTFYSKAQKKKLLAKISSSKCKRNKKLKKHYVYSRRDYQIELKILELHKFN